MEELFEDTTTVIEQIEGRYCKGCNNLLIPGYPNNQWFCPWCKLAKWYSEIKEAKRKYKPLYLKIRTASEKELDEISDQIAVIDQKAKGEDYPLLIQAGKLRRLELEIISTLAIGN